MKIHLVEGPQHGTTMYVEGQPNNTIYVPGVIAAPAMMKPEDYERPEALMKLHTHMYQARGKTRQGTILYEYAGEM